MNCAASAAHAVILMLWTSDCRAGDYRQLLYPARWRQYRLLPNWLCWWDGLGVAGLCGVGLSCVRVWDSPRVHVSFVRVCGKRRGHAGGVPSL